jgi:hypothetical protein
MVLVKYLVQLFSLVGTRWGHEQKGYAMPQQLNKFIRYYTCCQPISNGSRNHVTR